LSIKLKTALFVLPMEKPRIIKSEVFLV